MNLRHAVAVILAGCMCAAAHAAQERPNIIMILSDDMGYSDIGCYGGEIRTPNLDALAAGGLRFTRFYNTARCCPTRASLLTGLYPHQAGVGHMIDDRGVEGYRGRLNGRCVTIAEVLKRAGYATYMVGKWHVAPPAFKEGWPLRRGFDRYYGTIQGAGNYFDPYTLTRDNEFISPYGDPEYKPETYYYTDALSDHAVRFIADHQRLHPGKPFFMYLAYTAAHWPMQALDRDIARYKGKYDAGYEPIRRARYERMKKLGVIDDRCGISPQAGDWEKVSDKAWEARCMEVYAAMVDCMDQGIGRVVEQLRKGNQLDDTLIFYLQDNGACAEAVGRTGQGRPRPDKPPFPPMAPEALQTAAAFKQTRDGFPVRQGMGVMPGPADTFIAYGRGWANVSNTPFREYKHWVHEGGIATPLVVHWPRGFAARGGAVGDPAHLVDIMPTCLEVAGATYPDEFGGHKIAPPEGVSLVPAFRGRPLGERALFWEHERNCAVRLGRWKLVGKNVLAPEGPREDRWELYDVEADRAELDDLARRHPERVKEMSAMFLRYAVRCNVMPLPGGGKKGG